MNKVMDFFASGLKKIAKKIINIKHECKKLKDEIFILKKENALLQERLDKIEFLISKKR